MDLVAQRQGEDTILLLLIGVNGHATDNSRDDLVAQWTSGNMVLPLLLAENRSLK